MAKTLIGRVFENEETVGNDSVDVSENIGNEAEQAITENVSEADIYEAEQAVTENVSEADIYETEQTDTKTATDNVPDNTENEPEVPKPSSKRGRKKEQ